MLRQIRIKNFQSIEDLTYNFSEGLNVIVAPNNVGKSILNKIIEVLVNFDKLKSYDIKQYITFGKLKSDLFISDEENTYWVEIYLTKINYHVLEDSRFRFIGNSLPSGLIKALGLLLCDGGFVGNLIMSDHSKLLVDSNANINNQILSLIARDDNVEAILEESEQRMAEMNSNLRVLRPKRDSIRKELSLIHVEDTFAREEALKRVFATTQLVEDLIGLNELAEYLKVDSSNVSHLEGVLKLCQDLENLSYKFINIREIKEIRDMEKDLKVASELEEVLVKLDDISYKMGMVKEIKPVRFNSNILGLLSKLEQISINLSRVSKVKLPSLDKIKSCEELENLVSVLDDYSIKIDKQNKLKQEMKTLKEEIDSYGGEVYDCPIYGSIKLVNEECIRNYN